MYRSIIKKNKNMDCMKSELDKIPENIIYATGQFQNNNQNVSYLSNANSILIDKKKPNKILIGSQSQQQQELQFNNKFKPATLKRGNTSAVLKCDEPLKPNEFFNVQQQSQSKEFKLRPPYNVQQQSNEIKLRPPFNVQQQQEQYQQQPSAPCEEDILELQRERKKCISIFENLIYPNINNLKQSLLNEKMGIENNGEVYQNQLDLCNVRLQEIDKIDKILSDQKQQTINLITLCKNEENFLNRLFSLLPPTKNSTFNLNENLQEQLIDDEQTTIITQLHKY